MGDKDDRSTTDKGAAPGYILEPTERSWTDEPENPYEGVSRADPFEGRPPSKEFQPDETQADRLDGPDPYEPVPPGQPLPRHSRPGGDDT